MSPRRLIAAGVLRRRSCGSVLPEPSPAEVYEGRLPQVVGENLLDVPLGRAKGQLVPDEIDLREAAPAQQTATAWVPWCSDCRQPPVDGPWTLACAEHLARTHDGLHHGGAWTAEARPAGEVARLAAGGAR